LRYTENYAAGKNAIINGAVDNWQRGTSISLPSGVNTYIADRFIAGCTFSAGSATASRQTFTPGAAPVAGYEGQYFSRLTTGTTSSVWWYRQRIENVQSFAGQTITISFWVKASAANATTSVEVAQIFGSGGSTTTSTGATGPSITTSWQRFSVTMAIPSVSGKTIGTSSYVEISLYSTTGIASSLAVDLWGVQVEEGSVATAFQTATGTIQGEYAACLRYYERRSAGGANYGYGIAGTCTSTTGANFQVTFGSPKRTNSSIAFSGISIIGGAINASVTSVNGMYGSGTSGTGYPAGSLDAVVASGLTTSASVWLRDGGSGTSYIEFSSEL
jgi:hypothetical protein